MSDDIPLWVWQGFFGPMAAAQAAWAAVVLGPQVGVLVPLEGGPMPVDMGGVMGMFAVQTRPENPLSRPANMYEADASLVGRLVGA